MSPLDFPIWWCCFGYTYLPIQLSNNIENGWDVPPSSIEDGERAAKRFKFTEPQLVNPEDEATKMNGDQNATSGAHQYTFSRPENMEVDDCKSADTSHEIYHPSMCTSLLAHMAPAYSKTHSASHCLVSHIAPCPKYSTQVPLYPKNILRNPRI